MPLRFTVAHQGLGLGLPGLGFHIAVPTERQRWLPRHIGVPRGASESLTQKVVVERRNVMMHRADGSGNPRIDEAQDLVTGREPGEDAMLE